MFHFHTSEFGGVLAKITPYIGGAVIVASIIQTQDSSPLTDLWRVAISVALGVFVTLVGMIYHNMESRVGTVESNYMPRLEYTARSAELDRHLERIEKHLESHDEKIENLRRG